MTENVSKLKIELTPSDRVDEEMLQNITIQLRNELAEIEQISKVELENAAEIPKGAKAGDAISWGTIFVTLAASGGVITTLLGVLRSWLEKPDVTEIVVNGNKLTLADLSDESKLEVIKSFFKVKQPPTTHG
jgi:hypothetical protein